VPRGFRWVTRIKTQSPIAASAQSCSDLLAPYTSVVNNLKGHTLTRIVGRLIIAPDAVSEITNTLIGIAIVNSDAAAENAFPDSSDEQDNVRWLVRDISDNRSSSLSSRSNVQPDLVYDLRAQVLFRSDQEELHLILDQSSGGGVLVSFLFRMLLRMP